MSQSTKRRSTYRKRTYGTFTFKRPGQKPVVTEPRDVDAFWERQITTSEGHEASRDGKYRSGGPFYTVRTEFEDFPRSYVSSTNKFKENESYTGNCYVPIPDATSGSAKGKIFPPAADSSESTLNQKGAIAIDLCAPTNPMANTSTALGELLKDGFPDLPAVALWEKRAVRVADAGSQYLNVVFGWAPLISDITDASKAILKSKEILDQYTRDEGRPVRRDYEFPIEKSEKKVFEEPKVSALIGGTSFDASGSDLGTLTVFEYLTRKTWFVGCFTYGSPSMDEMGKVASAADQANKLLGTDLNPTVLWELTPWSWAFDWFSNLGNVISNISELALGGLVMRYGYVMEETTLKRIYTLDKPGLVNSSGPGPSASITTTVKKRVPANPYGFGLSWDGLSTYQQAVLAALGISRR